MDNTANPISGEAMDHTGNGNGNGTSTLEKAKEQITPVMQQAQQKAGEMMGQTKEQIMTQLATQKDVAAEGLSNIALAMRQASLSLQGQNQEKVGQYAETAADQLERFGNYLQEQDVDQILSEVQTYARQNPALILGSTFALGFFAARFLKNARPDTSSTNLPMRVEDTTPSYTASPDLAGTNYATAGSSLDYSSGATGAAGSTGSTGSTGAFDDDDLSGITGGSGSTGGGLGNDV